MTLLEDRHVAIGWRVVELVGQALRTEPLVKMNAAEYRRSVFNCEYLLIANCEYFLHSQLIDSQT